MYRVEKWDEKGIAYSKVRRCIFDRVFGYMRHINVKLLWINAHYIY
ncbi:hypothetical protein PpBr36_02278 [Pyricularia pennisetigena]|nr:hypothetical protein PpBr36_02278 [Pyricularia pennisetigena]TLS30899.1 hypothetical protein PpBr36_02278 [Pyricularia pennisetigena]